MRKRKNINNMRHCMLSSAFILTALLFTPYSVKDVKAAKDTTKPSISASIKSVEPSKTDATINITVKDSSGISAVKWAKGTQKSSYFNNSGTKVTLKNSNGTIKVKENGIYTIYAKDKVGNVRVKTVTISNIDSIPPVVSIRKATTDYINSKLRLTLTIKDEGLGVKSIKYLYGKKYTKDFVDAGKELSFTTTKATSNAYDNTYYYSGKFNVASNRIVTFLVEDMAGNKTIRRSYVTNIDTEAPTIGRTYSTLKITNKTVTVTVLPEDKESGVKEVRLLEGIKTIDDFANGKGTLLEPINDVISYEVKKNGYHTVAVYDNAGNVNIRVIKVSIIHKTAPKVSLNHSIMKQKATIHVNATSDVGIASITYVKGNVTKPTDSIWAAEGKTVNKNKFVVNSSGIYSVLVKDIAGNTTIHTISVDLELRAVWISYLEFANYGRGGFTKELFEKTIDTMFDNVVKLNMNAVIVQVRPFGDAMYDSAYFPWSRYISGTQGKDPGFDPLTYMVKAAHDRNLQIHAWLNPYRVTTANTNYTTLAKDNPARVWYEDKDKSNDRNVLEFDGNLYYNPAVKEVQNLITNGIIEIVENYDVDGIHFDDYFYPVLGTKYESNFDAQEYKAYASLTTKKGDTPMSIGDWRRNNVNTLIKNIYSSIKKIDSNVEFGISPGGFIDYLSSDKGYYVDYEEWMSSDGYIDYITPQIYWTFENSIFPYGKTVDRWLQARTSDTVKVYIGIANYKAGSTLEAEWKDTNILSRQVKYGRDTKEVDGYMFFRYDFFYNTTTKKQTNHLVDYLVEKY